MKQIKLKIKFRIHITDLLWNTANVDLVNLKIEVEERIKLYFLDLVLKLISNLFCVCMRGGGWAC